MKYQLLIVDDDPNIRMGLIQMIQNERSDLILALGCENGQAALNLMQKKKIDLMITDIRMPVLDGIGLLNRMKESNITMPVVVLSSYDDYNLVRSAMKAGASDYLLKPVDTTQLKNTIKAMVKSVEWNQSGETYVPSIQYDRQQLLEHFLLGSDPESQAVKGFRQQHRIGEDTWCHLCYVDSSHTLYSQKMAIQNYLLRCSSQFLEQCSAHTDVQFLYGEFGGYWIFLTLSPNQKQLFALLTPLYQHFREKGLKYAANQFPEAYPLRQLSFAKADCIRGLEQFYYDLPSASDSHPLCFENKVDTSLEKELLREASVSMAECDCPGSLRALELLLSHYQEQKPAISHVTRTLSGFAYDLMTRNARLIPIISSSKFTNYDLLDQIETSQSLSALRTNLVETLSHYTELLLDTLENKDDFVIKKAKSYIQDHYSDGITLTDVSAHVYLNASYFSSVFKAKTGITFRQYLRDYRIGKAKELLSTGEWKIYEIALAVGYQDAAHFVRAFKEIERISPSEYKQRI